MAPSTPTKYLNRFAKKYNLPHLNPHAFRYTIVSILLYKGLDIVSISKLVGHAQVSSTTDVYSHLIKKSEALTIKCISEVLLNRNEKN